MSASQQDHVYDLAHESGRDAYNRSSQPLLLQPRWKRYATDAVATAFKDSVQFAITGRDRQSEVPKCWGAPVDQKLFIVFLTSDGSNQGPYL